ncbi:MAG: phosphate ABC transporter ATP-binding protein PstB [Chloroflexi bacterium]|nr:phosphate ABC transporter ATP-binding protein PstB [Chloroflexota bacterium]
MAGKIEVRDLNFYYGNNHVLHDINVTIYEHEITALIGPSGCGKSTFLRTLNRMNDLIPSARATGEVVLAGNNVLAPTTDVVELRQRVGMVFQRPNPFPQSIFDNVAYGPRVLGMDRKTDLRLLIERSLRGAALWEEVKDKLGQSALDLALGQQQRLCIARTLAVGSEVILMDEPASALDPIATLAIEELMQALKPDYTIIIVTHNMQQAARTSDRTGFFLHGELVEFGPTNDIFTRPKDKRTEDYITGRFG